MYTVNSTLSTHEFTLWREWLDTLSALGGKIFSFPDRRATIAIMPEFPGSRMMLVSVSIADSREIKFKPKVGEYHALRRMFEENEFLKLPTVFYDHIGEEFPSMWAECFARAL